LQRASAPLGSTARTASAQFAERSPRLRPHRGLHAAKHAKSSNLASIDDGAIDDAEAEALAPFNRETGTNPFAVHDDMKDQMQTYVGIIRSAEDLEKGTSRSSA